MTDVVPCTIGRRFIALVPEGEAWNPVTHARTDLNVVSHQLSKSDEAGFWTMEFEIEWEDGVTFNPGSNRCVHFSEEVGDTVEHVFTGRLEGWPIGAAGKTIRLNAVGRPVDSEAAEIAALAGINDDPYFLFSDKTDKRTSDTVLASRSALLHWTRTDSAPLLTDIIQGSGFFDIGDNFIEGTLELDQPSEPVSRVDVTVKAEWQADVPVRIDVAGLMPGGGTFGSLLNAVDVQDIPQEGSQIGDWTVIHSNLTPTGRFGYSPEYSVDNKSNRAISGTAGTEPTKIKFARNGYDLDLVVMAVRKANIRETLTFSLAWGGQQVTGYEGTTESISLECRNMRIDSVSAPTPEFVPYSYVHGGDTFMYDGVPWRCVQSHQAGGTLYDTFDKFDPLLFDFSPSGGPTMGVFFGAPVVLSGSGPSGQVQTIYRDPTPGIRAIAYALLMARAKLALGVRVIEASFEVPWEDVRTITGRERIRIADPAIPGGEMTGKVKSVDANLESGRVRITIAAAPGNGGIEPVAYIPTYASQGLAPAGVLQASFQNTYTQQEAYLASLPGSSSSEDLIGKLKDVATKIDIVMSPASGTAEINTPINMGTFTFDTDKMVDLG